VFILQLLEPYKAQIAQVAVESTYNWYWLVDGLEDHGYPVVLANPARMQQYDGLKHTDDVSDAYFLGELMRLGNAKKAVDLSIFACSAFFCGWF
jgi:transposase